MVSDDGGWITAFRQRTRIARREIASLGSEKTILLALLIQLFIAAFSSFLVVGLVALYDPGASGGDTGLTFGVVGNGTDAVVPVLEDEPDWRYERYELLNESILDFRARELDAVLAVTRTGDDRYNVTAIAPQGSFSTTLVVAETKELLERFEQRVRERHRDRLERRTVPVPPESRSSPYYDFTYTVLVPLLMFLPVFISGSIVADSLTEEFDRGTIELLRAAPLTDAAIVDGKMLAMAGIVPPQAALWLGLFAINGTRIAAPLALVAFVTAAAVVVVALGATVALGFRDRRRSQFVYSSAVIGVFAVASMLPESPANTVALLAIGSATTTTVVTVAGAVAAAVVAVLAVRRLLARRPLA